MEEVNTPLEGVLKIPTFEVSGFLGMFVCLAHFCFNNNPPIRRGTHIQHSICFIQGQKLHLWIDGFWNGTQKKGDPPRNGGRTNKQCTCIEMWCCGVFFFIFGGGLGLQRMDELWRFFAKHLASSMLKTPRWRKSCKKETGQVGGVVKKC